VGSIKQQKIKFAALREKQSDVKPSWSRFRLAGIRQVLLGRGANSMARSITTWLHIGSTHEKKNWFLPWNGKNNSMQYIAIETAPAESVHYLSLVFKRKLVYSPYWLVRILLII
jgi:hypothetical protein